MAAAGTVVGPQEEKTQYRAQQSGICQFQLQSVARGGICFSGLLSQPGALTLMWRQCTHRACRLPEWAGYLEAEPQLPGRMR